MSYCNTLDGKLILDKKLNDSKLGKISNCSIDVLNFDKNNKLYVNDNGRNIYRGENGSMSIDDYCKIHKSEHFDHLKQFKLKELEKKNKTIKNIPKSSKKYKYTKKSSSISKSKNNKKRKVTLKLKSKSKLIHHHYRYDEIYL